MTCISLHPFKKEEGTFELSSKIDFNASLKPYIEFTVEVNRQESYRLTFTFQVDTSAHMKKLRFTTNPNEGKSIRIEKIGIKIELSLVQIEFLDLITSRSYISLNKKMKLGSKSFEIRDLSLYAQRSAVINKEATACPRCGAIISTGWRYCPYCSYNL